MKKTIIYFFILLIIGCSTEKKDSNNFSLQSDTLTIETLKQKGNSIFQIDPTPPHFLDTNTWKNSRISNHYPNYPVGFPKNIEDMKLGIVYLMLDSLRFYDKTKKVDVLQSNFSLYDRQLLMIRGLLNKTEVLIVDANNNKDLNDDSVHMISNLDNNIIYIPYEINLGDEKKIGTGWIKIEEDNGEIIWSVYQHLIANFIIDDNNYTLAIADVNSCSFCFQKPVLYLLSKNGLELDTFMKDGIVNLGEYFKLDNQYYKFHDLYSGDGTLVLIKAENYEELVGLQVGMIAPSFKCVASNSDTLKSSNYIKNKPLLITNLSNCTPSSYTIYDNLYKSCNDSLNIIVVDYGLRKQLEGTQIDATNEFNKNFYKQFRNTVSGYNCYLIGSNGRVIDKFRIFNWENHLSCYKSQQTITMK